MTSPNTNNARRRGSWIAILLDKLRLGLHFYLLVFSIVVLTMGANSAFAQTQACAILTGGDAGAGRGVSPIYLANQDGRANEGCTILITLNADGSIATTFPNPAPSYDNGLDDNLIGVINNTSKTITALQLTSATVPIFGLEDDGVCGGPPGWTFSPLGPNPNCAIATDPHHYGPAGINYTIFNANSGIVNFGNGGIAPGGNAFFSLEGGNLTKIVVVVIPGLAITKQVTVVGGGAALPGGQLDYLVHVTNPSNNPPNFQASSVVITDDLNSAGVGRLTLVNPAPTMNGLTTGVTVVGSVITADFSTPNGPLQPGQSIDLRFRAQIAAAVPAGTTITNTGLVTWNTPTETASASASVVIAGAPVPGAGTLNGTAWLDANFNKVPDTGEPRLVGWTVALFLNGVQLQSVLTDANGVYRLSNVAPTDGTSNRYELRFTAPGVGPNTAKLGIADSVFTNSLQRITNIAVPSNSNLQNLNLPIAPNGVVYNSSTRAPIAGVTLNMLSAGSSSPLPAACFDDPAQQGQITQAGGYYRFDLNFTDPACSSGGSFVIKVTAPPAFVAGESRVIPPASNAATAPFSVPTCPGSLQDALPAVPFCEAQGSEFAPPSSVPPGSTGTKYYLNLTLDGTSVPGSNQIYNNHIPVDPQIAGSISITKTTPLLNVTRGQLVPYTITIGSLLGASPQGVRVVDRYPAGFRYIKGSARLNGVPTEPTVTAGQLAWSGLSFDSDDHPTITLLLAVGAGVGEGEFTNRAQALQGVTGQPMSGEATATVRVIPDQTFDCTDVFGKVFDDVNRNGRQDSGEKGLPGVRVVTAQGLTAKTDQYGRFHITCAIVPNDIRGSNFVLKLDDRTLPSGFRMSTDLMQIKHATAGKALKFDFGASIYRVVAIDLSDAAFEPGKTEIRTQWKPRVDVLLGELRKAPSVLRLSYVADTEDASLVERRMQALKRQVTEAWDTEKDAYVLTIEPEVFWRRGAPPKRSDLRVPGSR
jgi:large repetitive protein